ncbi:hypothetical protein INT44_004840 [Umbelopsis vinacea]|uniref:GH18 domain-containing protein n=1 Tax=Umbelopsis vinacea TaxID=44442 RepID=A0A8H7Q8I8_9FUNG|nr:hypothetical protein INT44_004840 [Umbelopsis vinacea]
MKLLTLSALASIVISQVAARAVGSDGKLVVGYWMSDDVSTLDFGKVTHINYAFSTIQNGVPSLPATIKKLVPAAHAADTKVLLSIGGWGGGNGFTPSFNNSAGRAKFVAATKKLIDDTGIDGVDIDWEYPGEPGACGQPYGLSDTKNFLTVLNQLRAAIGKEKLITAATATHPFFDENGKPSKDISAFAKVFDWINLMSYDLNGIWGLTTGPNAPIIKGLAGVKASVVQGVTDWHKAGMPIEQIVVGTPFYGHNMTSIKSMTKNAGTHEYDPVQGGNTGHDCNGGGFSTETGWQDIIPYLYENRTTAIPPWVRKFDTITRTPWLTNSETNEFISYDDPISLAEKVDYVVCMDLLGVMTWELSLDNGELLPVLNQISEKAAKHGKHSKHGHDSSKCIPTGPVVQ